MHWSEMIGLYIISHLFSVADCEILEGFRGKTNVPQTNPTNHKCKVKEFQLLPAKKVYS